MSIFKKRLVPLIAVICAFICFTVLGLTLSVKPEQTFADTATTPTVTNVEDYYENNVAMYAGVCAGGGNILKLGTSTVDIEMVTSNGNYKGYVSTKTATEDTAHNSKNTYAGNLSVLTYSGANTSATPETTFGIYEDNADNVIAFRTVYMGKNINLIGRLGGTTYAGSGGGVGGYNFAVSNSSVSLIALKDGVNEDGVQNAGQVLTSNTTISSVNYNDSKTLESGDELLITYGAVGTNYYLKIERYKNNALETIIDKFSTPITSDVELGHDYAVDYMWITSAFNTPLVIGGIEKPIMADLSSADDVTIDGEKTVGTAISEIALPQGYTYVDGTKTVAKGWNEFDVVAGNYYEKQSIKSAYILGAGETVKNVETSTTMGYSRNKSVGSHTIYNLGFNKQFTPKDQPYSIYISNMSAEDDSIYSKSTFAGNITINAIDETNSSNKMHAFVDRQDNADAILAFRTKWLGANISLIGRMTDTMWYTDGFGGYQFDVTATAVTLKMCRLTSESLAEKVVDTYPLTSALSTNDELIITYGATTNGEVNSLYIKIEKVVDGSVTELLNKFDTPIMYKGTIPHSTSYSGLNFMYVACPGTTPLVIGGINKPICAEETVDASATVSGTLFGKLSTVTIDPALGLEFVNAEDTVIEVGVDTYEGLKTYYDKKYSVDIKISLAEPDKKAIYLKVGDNEPTLVYTYETKAYVFEESIIDGKAFIGWIDSEGNIYDAGDALAFEDAVADTVYTLVNITFNLEDGASIRYTSDEKGEYGMRFTLNVDTDVLDKAYISNAKYAIAPTDTYFTEGKFVDGAESVAKDLVWTEDALIEDNKIAFAISSIQYQNFAREFGGVAFFTVTYADGGTRVIRTSFESAKNSRSVYEVSMSLLSDMYRDGLTAENSDRVGVLEDYVNQVADVTLTEEGETLKVDLSTNYDRTPETIPYEISATVTESGEGYEVALEITFKEGNGLGEEGTFATQTGGAWIVPVIVRVGTEVYEMNPTDGAVVEYKSASAYENYKIVMTFVYTPVKVN